jgi:large-conductance mechanosensitive channel
MILVRYLLIALIIYLLLRAFAQIGEDKTPPARKQEPEKKDKKAKGVPKEIGEYVDYEEIKD